MAVAHSAKAGTIWLADINFSETNSGFSTIIKYMEMPHAKRPQAGAGTIVKHMCDLDMIQGKVRIQNN